MEVATAVLFYLVLAIAGATATSIGDEQAQQILIEAKEAHLKEKLIKPTELIRYTTVLSLGNVTIYMDANKRFEMVAMDIENFWMIGRIKDARVLRNFGQLLNICFKSPIGPCCRCQEYIDRGEPGCRQTRRWDASMIASFCHDPVPGEAKQRFSGLLLLNSMHVPCRDLSRFHAAFTHQFGRGSNQLF